MRVWPGSPYPLGANWDGMGVNFALFSGNGTGVELCLFEDSAAGGIKEVHRIPVRECTNQVWHCYLPDVSVGQLYGYRVYGPYDPQAGHCFNPHKVLLDPYAKCIGQAMTWDSSVLGYRASANRGDLSFDDQDSTVHAALGRVIDTAFTWGNDRLLRTPWSQTVIYELHVKGFTARHPGVPEKLRGTYAGLATPACIDYLRELGVTAVELLPVHYAVDEQQLNGRGFVNYWGYNTLGFFAPNPRYSACSSPWVVSEFKSMVRTLHAAGIEVILDVVYNHTAEGNQWGPTLSMRGIDNAAYYRLAEGRTYVDFTGCGNTLNVRHPRVLQLIMDSLRYWVTDMHIDGFRFDLASALARELYDVDRLAAFFDIIHQDPVLSQVKLIAEPWDLGMGGYQVGNFPLGWAEWNGKYRDCIRSFWKGDGGTVREFASRFSGSSDLYAWSGRKPYASINYITAHDGFTLRDLVSYNQKHNDANGENNRDGTDWNLSWNCGVEGETSDASVNELRSRQQRNFLATLILSQGVPMLFAGDERSHSQRGNNNAYCQDNETTWLNWDLNPEQRKLLQFTRDLIRLRRGQPAFRRRTFFHGRPLYGSAVKDIYWLTPRGSEMSDENWCGGKVQCLGVGLVGNQIEECDERGEKIEGDSFLVLLNTSYETVPFQIGSLAKEFKWELVFNSAEPDGGTREIGKLQSFSLSSCSMVVLRVLEAGELIRRQEKIKEGLLSCFWGEA